VTDDDHVLAPARDRGSDVLEARSRREPIVGLGLGPERPRQLVAGLPCAQQRAREHGVRVRALGSQPRAERSGLLAALSGERAQLVRFAGGGFGMADEVEAHGV